MTLIDSYKECKKMECEKMQSCKLPPSVIISQSFQTECEKKSTLTKDSYMLC